ncbi:hypothetical protein G6F68_017444 [Rhizopus microsporus]|nr:hypothetical protein G6F68_017444 [Rhizopus microsporus]
MGATARRLARRNSHPTCSGVNNLACAVCASPVERSTVVSISTALRVAYCGDGLDLDHRGRVVQRLDLRDRVGRVGRREEAAAQRHHVLEMPHIGHEDGDLDHVRQAGAAGFQRAAQIREGLLALGQKAARDDLAVVRNCRVGS